MCEHEGHDQDSKIDESIETRPEMISKNKSKIKKQKNP